MQPPKKPIDQQKFRQDIIAANPDRDPVEVERELDEYDKLMAEHLANDPSKTDPVTVKREARIREIVQKLFRSK